MSGMKKWENLNTFFCFCKYLISFIVFGLGYVVGDGTPDYAAEWVGFFAQFSYIVSYMFIFCINKVDDELDFYVNNFCGDMECCYPCSSSKQKNNLAVKMKNFESFFVFKKKKNMSCLVVLVYHF